MGSSVADSDLFFETVLECLSILACLKSRSGDNKEPTKFENLGSIVLGASKAYSVGGPFDIERLFACVVYRCQSFA